MKIICIFTSCLALLFIKNDWIKLSNELSDLYLDYLRKQHQTSEKLKYILVSGEDRRFFKHGGFDIIAICRIVWKRFFFGIVEGGSTIEQQLVRVITNRYERKISRKIKEILLSTLITRVIPKSDIPGVYLYVAYFGWRMNGIDQAYKRLNYSVDNISEYDAANLIARLKYPEPKISPISRIKQINIRQKHLLFLYYNHLEKDIYHGFGEKIEYEAV